ncbi:MAG: lipopolysaccharide transport periplasmic protein LptA [Gammaproteobacteria bacterium]|nr:lipopolysaccharide transport periplasmic protein LptA [Gammaproteobacteria bacterium]MBL6999493.1 lipopolysaccharide transport periplasmic protein LptA [Gammaproteobacteria bacterium]
MKRVNIPLLSVIISLLSFPIYVNALSTDRAQAIDIQADKLDIDDAQHISIYQGNVEMHQGSLHIIADKIVFFFDSNNDLLRLEIEGSPASLKQLSDKNQKLTGSARKIIYTDNQLLLNLEGEARFNSDRDTIEGDWISVNTDTDALRAGSKKGENRVRMLIQPKNLTGTANPSLPK